MFVAVLDAGFEDQSTINRTGVGRIRDDSREQSLIQRGSVEVEMSHPSFFETNSRSQSEAQLTAKDPKERRVKLRIDITMKTFHTSIPGAMRRMPISGAAKKIPR